MAYHILIVSSMLIVGLATSTPTPATPTSVTVETCGITKACGPNDSYSIPCPASRTCNEYYKCDKGVVSIQTCNKAFYLFWLTPVYDPAKNCCTLVYSLSSPVRPNENGQCPDAAPDHTALSKDVNAHVKRQAEPVAKPVVPVIPEGAAVAEPTKETLKEEAKPTEPTADTKPEDEQKTGEVEQVSKAEIKDDKPQTKHGKPVKSSANAATAQFSAVVAVLITVFMSH